MADDVEFTKLPLEECCGHKSWRARLHGYTEAIKLFAQADDEKAPIFHQLASFIPKMISDSNAVVQEKGLEAALLFVQNSSVASKIVKDVMSVIVCKCIGAPKAKTRELSLQIAMMYIEIEKQESVQEELLKGMEQKNPKTVAGCVFALSMCLKEFGSKIIDVKPLVKLVPTLLEDRDKNVREETKNMVIEIYRWVGESIKSKLTLLKQLQQNELEAEFTKIKGGKAVRLRYTRSQQIKLREQQQQIVSSPVDIKVEEDSPVDTLEFLDPINVLEKLPSRFFSDMEAKKWQSRKEALEDLDVILKYPKYEKEDYGELIHSLVKVISKDSNIIVVGVAIRCLQKLAQGLKKQFQNYGNFVLPSLLEKFREKKANIVQPLRDAVDAAFLSLSLDSIQEDVLAALENKNPSVKAETCLFLSRCFSTSPSITLNKKLLKIYITALLKALNESDPFVRDSSAEALGTAMKLVGDKVILPFLGDVDNLKLLKIKGYAEKAVIISKKSVSVTKNVSKAEIVHSERTIEKSISSMNSVDIVSNLEVKPEMAETVVVTEVSALDKPSSTPELKKNLEQFENNTLTHKTKSVDHVPKVDLSCKVTDQLLQGLADKNWKVRNDALLSIAALLAQAKCIKSDLGELPLVLAQRFSDSNVKIAVTALDVCKSIATAMGSSSKLYVKVFLHGIISALGDSRQMVRASAVTCIDTWGHEAGFKEIFDSEMIANALKTGSPILRIQIFNLLSRILPNLKERSFSKEEVMLCVPYLYASLEDRNADVRKEAHNAVLGIMIHLGYAIMLKEAEKLKPGSAKVVTAVLEKVRLDVPVKEDATVKKKKEVDLKNSKTKVSVTKSNKMEETTLSHLLPVNNMKQQRLIDEQRLKILKWHFTNPRSEFVDLLREQMTLAKINKNLVSDMFHSDFKYHLKAIESLTEELSNTESITSNLDLILKWMTLRFFDTNPCVLLKGLEYLNKVFSLLTNNEYVLCDSEANSFIPYLIMKIGDPKDVVRDRVRSILRQISVIYSPAKVFSLVMEGIKSKNARQRTECLEELSYLVEKFGTTVCQPNTATALKEIAKQISDRDNTVRNAALNCIVKAWYLEGDKTLKMIGHLSEKESTLLDERLRRSVKNHSNTSQSPKSAITFVEKLENVACIEENSVNLCTDNTASSQSASIIETPNIEEKYKNDIIHDSPSQVAESLFMESKFNSAIQTAPIESLAILVQDLSNSNIKVAFQAASKLRFILESQEGVVVNEYTNLILYSLVIQLRYLNSYSLDVYGLILPQTYTMLLRIVDDIFFKKTPMGNLATVDNLHILIYELLYSLAEDTTAKYKEEGYNKVIVLFLSRIIENANLTNVTCAIIKLLYNVVLIPPKNIKLTELTTKCLLKSIYVLKKCLAAEEIDFDIDSVLYECYLFFKSFPQNTWKSRPTNLPLKAIKTLLLTLVQWKGKNIFSHLSLIENPYTSELCSYLKACLKCHPSVKESSSSRITQAMSEHLSEVFMKIADEKTAKEGLYQFYQFKQQNPNVDLAPYISHTSKCFQDYVENGLNEIEREIFNQKYGQEKCEPGTPSRNDFEYINLAQYYLDKLKLFHKRVGLPPPECPDFVTK